jgi:hypothetical protein
MRFCILLVLIFAGGLANARQQVNISTVDIDHFWEAYDSLATASDSIAVFQRFYIDRATLGLKEFIRARNFEAGEYVALIKNYPKFWISIRPNTEHIATRGKEIETIFQKFKELYPAFKPPDVCFAIGCLRTGGTTRPDLIMIGSEIASADSTTRTAEFKNWLMSVLSNSSDITAMVAHEAVHTQQKNNRGFAKGFHNHRLLTQSIREGCADFIGSLISGSTFNKAQYEYGLAHEPELWKEFQQHMNEEDLSRWLYNGLTSVDRPADLGYFIGYRICERYYNQSKNKAKAIRELLNIKDYPKFLKKSGYGFSN